MSGMVGHRTGSGEFGHGHKGDVYGRVFEYLLLVDSCRSEQHHVVTVLRLFCHFVAISSR